MKLKLDENLSRHLAPRVAAQGYDVSTAADEDLLGHPDYEVASAARAEGRIVLTLDVGFANLRDYPAGTHWGIIVFRLRTLGPLPIMDAVEAFVRDHDLAEFSGCVVTVEPGRVRVRRPPSAERE